VSQNVINSTVHAFVVKRYTPELFGKHKLKRSWHK